MSLHHVSWTFIQISVTMVHNLSGSPHLYLLIPLFQSSSFMHFSESKGMFTDSKHSIIALLLFGIDPYHSPLFGEINTHLMSLHAWLVM